MLLINTIISFSIPSGSLTFLGGLFKRKPGGTFFGNLLRKTAGAATGGILGNGAMMISQEDADKRDLSDSDYIAKYGMTKAGAVIPTIQPQRQILPVQQQLDNSLKQQFDKAKEDTKKKGFKEFLNKYWWALLAPLGLLILTIIYFAKPRKKRR